MSMLDALRTPARRHRRAHPDPVQTIEVVQWIWQCGRCPDLTPRPCTTEAEAAFLGSQHDVTHHGIALGMPGNGATAAPHRLGLPDQDVCLQADAGLTATDPTSSSRTFWTR